MAKKKTEKKTVEKTPEVKEEKKPELTVEQKLKQDVEKFKAQLLQALEVNDRLIKDLENKERELTVFQEVKTGLEKVIEDQTTEITTFKEQIQALHMEKFQERVSTLARKWVKKYSLSDDKIPEVTNMLSKFQDEQELNRMEALMGLTGGKEVSVPKPLTKPTAQLTETFAQKGPSYEDLSPEDKREYLWKQMETLKNRLPK